MRRPHSSLLFAFVLSGVAGCHSLPHTTTTNVTVSVSPANPTVSTFGSQAFSATVTGSTNTAVTWQVNGVTGGNVTTGTISATGVYSAPHAISSTLIPPNKNASVTITAISQASASASGTATLTLLTQGQAAQNGAIELGSSGGNVHASTMMGNSISCCGGTLGSLVVSGGTNYILSNNHVLADSDAGTVGDAIIQPGLIDSGTCTSTGTTTVANLSQFVTLENNANPIDAATAQIVAGKVDTSGNILLLGASTDANGVPVPGAPHAGSGVSASLGQSVAKVGRTSGLTCSTIDSISDAFSVQYFKTCGATTPSFTVNYVNQISVAGGEFSVEGDSGSLIVTQNTADPVALLFAGSDTDTAASPIGNVLNALTQNNGAPTIVGGAAHQVIGCTLPGPSNAVVTLPAAAVSKDAMQTAVAARDTHASELLAMTGVRGVAVGASLDYAGQPALVLFVAPGTPHSTLPVQVDGVRTRIIETSSESARGILSADEAQPLAPQEATFAVTSLPAWEMARAMSAHKAHVDEWMKQPGVQGFGVTSSADSEGEAALMVFLIRGAAHDPIPAVIDGVRTRIRESSRFHAGRDGSQARRGCSVDSGKAGQTNRASTSTQRLPMPDKSR